jgi:D-glycerate 3-kinase
MSASDSPAPQLLLLASWAARRRAAVHGTFVLGISGAQGTGKSTLAARLTHLLAERFDLRAAVLSLDDLYLTRAEREQLAADVHPLLRTRGVPGTHDVALGRKVIASIHAATQGQHVSIPRFDKARDDRASREAWPELEGPVDVLLFEGWCLGAAPEPDGALAAPINDLEREQDRDGRWRSYVNGQLAGRYVALFKEIGALLFLAAPDMQSSLAWRIQQERELAKSAGAGARAGRAVMSDADVERFVQHYERISRHMLAEVPSRADAVLELDGEHGYASISVRD